jgi:hypothetical protein
MSVFFDQPKAPLLPPAPAPPQASDAAVQKRMHEETRKLPGRASQFFTNPQTQLDPGPSRKQYLGGM